MRHEHSQRYRWYIWKAGEHVCIDEGRAKEGMKEKLEQDKRDKMMAVAKAVQSGLVQIFKNYCLQYW